MLYDYLRLYTLALALALTLAIALALAFAKPIKNNKKTHVFDGF